MHVRVECATNQKTLAQARSAQGLDKQSEIETSRDYEAHIQSQIPHKSMRSVRIEAPIPKKRASMPLKE